MSYNHTMIRIYETYYDEPDGHQAPDINDLQTNDAIHQRSFQTTLGCAFVQFSDFYRQKKTLKNREVLKTPPIATFLMTFLNLINHYIISTLYHLYFI